MAEVIRHDTGGNASSEADRERMLPTVKIAAFNALLVIPLVLFDSYTFRQAGFPSGFAPRYGAGWYYFIAIVEGIAIFLTSRFFIRRKWSLERKCMLPWYFTAGSGAALAIIFFQWHAALRQTFLYMGGALPGVLAVFARYSEDDAYAKRNVKEGRSEWIKERATFWRTVAISGAVGFVAMGGPWYAALRAEAERMTDDKRSQLSLMTSSEVYMAIVFAYMVMCPIFQSFRKAWYTDRLLVPQDSKKGPLAS
jgi:hypothetical protein